MQVIERDNKYDEILREQLEQQGLDPDDDVNSKSFRRYKEQLFQHLRDSISKRFDDTFKDCPGIGEILPKTGTLIDDLILVLDDLVPCFPPRFSLPLFL
jgi:hypothetical protein